MACHSPGHAEFMTCDAEIDVKPWGNKLPMKLNFQVLFEAPGECTELSIAISWFLGDTTLYFTLLHPILNYPSILST